MPDATPVTERLGTELRARRTLAGLSQRELAARMDELRPELGMKQPRVHRIEIGEAVPTASEFDIWLLSTMRKDEDKEAFPLLAPLLEAAHNPSRPWRGLLGGQDHLQARAGERELSCKTIRNVSLSWIPGLLQTAEYARQLLAQVSPPGADIAAQVAGRLERQRILYQDGRRFEFVIGEQALLWAPAPGVMSAQRDRLESLATLATVELAILPLRRVGVAAWHDFIYRQPTDAEESAYVDGELLHAEFGTTEPSNVERYLELWDRLWSAAVHGKDAVQLIRRAGKSEIAEV